MRGFRAVESYVFHAEAFDAAANLQQRGRHGSPVILPQVYVFQ